MALVTEVKTLVAATTTKVHDAAAGHSSAPKGSYIQNKTGADLYIGGENVTNSGATEGITISNNATLSIDLILGEDVYAYSAAGGKVVVLTTRN